MLKLRLYPIEIRAMFQVLFQECAGQEQVPPIYQSAMTLLFLEYLRTWPQEKITAWIRRNPKREYQLSIKIPIAKALYDSLDSNEENLADLERLFYVKLKEAIIHYRNSYATNPYPI